MEEMVLSCSSATETGWVWNPSNALALHGLESMRCAPLGLAYSEDHHVAYAVLPDKAVATAHYLTKRQPRHRAGAPEKLGAIATDGVHIAAGSQTGRLYVWQVATGHLLRIWEGHYKGISRVAFAADGATLLSGSEDASVKSWALESVLDWQRSAQDEILPQHTFLGHTLGVADLCIPPLSGEPWAVSAAKDRTLRVHNYASGYEVLCVVLPSHPRCVAADASCLTLFAGAVDGKIYQADMYPERAVAPSPEGGRLLETLLGHPTEAATPAGRSGRGGALGHHYTAAFEGHKGAVNCIAVTADGQTLVSGGFDGACNVWQVASRQLLRTFHDHKGSVTALLIARVPSVVPSEKESAARAPFAQLNRHASTGEAPSDWVVPVLKRVPAAGAKRKREDGDAAPPAAPAAAAAPDAQLAAAGSAEPARGRAGSRDTLVGNNAETVALVGRLYSLLRSQQERIRELEEQQRAG